MVIQEHAENVCINIIISMGAKSCARLLEAELKYVSSGPSALCGIICDKILKTIASQMHIFDPACMGGCMESGKDGKEFYAHKRLLSAGNERYLNSCG